MNPGGQGNGPGLVLLVPIIDRMVKVSMQTVALDVPPQDVITRDNVSLKVSAVIYFRVVDPERAIVAVQDYLYATSQIAQTIVKVMTKYFEEAVKEVSVSVIYKQPGSKNAVYTATTLFIDYNKELPDAGI